MFRWRRYSNKFCNLPSGGSGNFTYQWYYQDGLITCPTGSSTTGWTIISGGTTSSYDPPSGLVANRTYACLVAAAAGNSCAASTGWAAQCRQVTVTTNPTINYGTLTSGNESFCITGDPTNITFATAPSGGTFTYQWYYQDGLISCPTGSAITGWTIIVGATSSSYDAPIGLSTSRTYACMVTVTGACVSGSAWATNCRQGNYYSCRNIWHTY
ncbi:MAG: hypothetical protein M0D57_08710 [Sphingobacteriales bacterium JAD_PAG50586_3]|nr:MAG: hypothetical protein M0D57_08710 [Sphingobacteriales bacterium JAD_PAG50586_3]